VLQVTRAESDDERREVARVADWAFAQVFDPGRFEKYLPLKRTVESYLATADGESAGACGVFPLELTVPGGERVATSGVTDVGVLPGHRRRGVLTAMMRRMLDDAVAAGRLAAILYASEAGIYGRYGYGPASRAKRVSVPVARSAFRNDILGGADPRSGRIRVLDPADRGENLPGIHERYRRSRPGEVGRSQANWDFLLAVHPTKSVEDRLCLVHETADGVPDGYVLYTVADSWDHGGPAHTAEVVELVAVDAAAELALWAALFDLDLVATVEAHVPADSLLFDALADRWAVGTRGEGDQLWVRILDVPAALAARHYRVPVELGLEVVDDRRPEVAGTFRLSVGHDGTGVVERAEPGAAADLRIGIAELGSCWLGGGSFCRLAQVGRVQEHTIGTLALADAAFGWSPGPHVTHHF
jgi:predicted acetyltransferase